MATTKTTYLMFARVRGEFRPKRTDDLRLGLLSLVGQVGEFDAIGAIEDGPYAGQMAMGLSSEWMEAQAAVLPPQDSDSVAAWVPECDLVNAEILKEGIEGY